MSAIQSLTNMASGIFGNFANKEKEKLTGMAEGQIAQSGMEDGAKVQIGIAEKKSELNLRKIPSAYFVETSQAALRTAEK